MSGVRVLFIDRDGTLIEEPADYQVDRIDKVRLLPEVIPALLRLQSHGYRFVMVSNQDGLGTASFPQDEFDPPHAFVLALFESQGIRFDEILICPHLPDAGCSCRKPATGLLAPYLARTTLDIAHSYVIGDRDTDIALAQNIGVTGIRIGEDGERWSQIANRLCSARRVANVVRTSNETDIQVTVDLDNTAPLQIHTGIGFFDHMLEQLAKHGGFALQLQCSGDLHIDEHHTVEDVALTLGAALRDALGSKIGIARYGFVLPMDEASAQVSVDLSGRPFCVFDSQIRRARVGELPTEMVQHFFHSLAQAMGATLHLSLRGDNAHHQVEAAFKGLGRALRQAIHIESDSLPSTKGML